MTGHSGRVEQALRSDDTVAALREYRELLAADPKNAQAWTGMGVLLYGSGKMAEAADALRHALEIDPATPRAELFLALSRADLSKCEEAAPVLERHFEREPAGKIQRLIGLTLLGCLHGSKEEATALRIAARMKQSYPGDPDVLYASAELYTRMWSETANELITAHPDSYRVHQLAGEVNEAQGNLGQAIRQYRAALAENPKLTQMHFRIGQLLLQSGAPDADQRATEEFRAELAINPQSATSALAIAEIERHQGKLTEAGADYTHAMAIEPGLPQARVGFAQTLLAQHHVEAAQKQLHELIAEHPDNAQAHYALMLAYREGGQLPEASKEMATFQRLQRNGADQFQKKLNALLTGTPGDPPPAPAKGPTQ
jgi:predicted Zn-dependent protease